MRKTVIFLLLVNAAYFLWQVRSQDKNASLAVRSVNAPPLMLLSEVTEQAPTNVPPIVAQHEAPPSSEATVDVTPATENTAPPTSPQQWCGVLGAFEDQALAEKANTVLLGQGYKSTLSVEETQEGGGYLVYLPPFESRDAAVKKLRELQAQSIDSFVISEGERINGISLGVFSKEGSAQKLQAQLKSKGHGAQIVQSVKVYSRYTLVISGQSPVSEAVLATLSKSVGKGDLRLQERVCSE